jgi:hypothetical protein
MVSLMHTLALLGCSPMRVSISIRKVFKVVITLREDFYNSVEIALQAISHSALDELERGESPLIFHTTQDSGNGNLCQLYELTQLGKQQAVTSKFLP